jgi:hypothetical protein
LYASSGDDRVLDTTDLQAESVNVSRKPHLLFFFFFWEV